MARVALQILVPADGLQVPGAPSPPPPGTPAVLPVTVSARVQPDASGPLYFFWYSSLRVQTDPALLPLPVSGTALDGSVSLSVGSHVLSMVAADQPSLTPAQLQQVRNGGIAGGPPPAQPPCRVHVLLASVLAPANGATLSHSSPTLTAEAPATWTTPGYQAQDRIAYRWRFDPIGDPPGRAAAELVPGRAGLVFVAGTNSQAPGVSYVSALPSTLGRGAYRVTLRVEDAQHPDVFAEASRDVSLTD